MANETKTFNIVSEFNSEHKISIRVSSNGRGLSIVPEGYSDNCGDSPIFIDFMNEDGELGVYVWGNRREQEPTNIISLSEAKEFSDAFSFVIDLNSINDEVEVYSMLDEADVAFQEELSIKTSQLKLNFLDEEDKNLALIALSPLNCRFDATPLD